MDEEAQRIPKPMITVGGRPILWHIMKWYTSWGFDDFVLCLGLQSGDRQALLPRQRGALEHFVLSNGGRDVELPGADISSWRVTFVDTGAKSTIAERLRLGVHLQEALVRNPMIFTKISIEGVWMVEPERHEDERGFFARTWDPEEFAANGLKPRLAQCSISFNASRGTLRGPHYQAAPHEEAKLVRGAAGAMFDVALDLRAHSPTFRSWFGTTLSGENQRRAFAIEWPGAVEVISERDRMYADFAADRERASGGG